MLQQFSFKNFKSFRDDTTLDLRATSIQDYSQQVIETCNGKILPTAAIFGANASGKSNVIDAFRYMSEYVVYSFGFGGDTAEYENKYSFKKPTPFLLETTSKTAETSFEVFFVGPDDENNKVYQYGFTVNDKGIKEEWLYTKVKSSRNYKLVFERDENEYNLSGIDKKSRENIEISLEKESLIVSLGSKLKIKKLKTVRDWFYKNEFADFGQPFENFILSSLIPDGFAEDKKVQDKVVKYLSAFDSSIKGFIVNEIESNSDTEPREVSIKTIHKSNNTEDVTVFPLNYESAGTLKMFALYPLFQRVMEQGSVLFIDELNSKLHPLLARAFILNFLNPETNPNHAQIIFTTHDSWLLNCRLLRRDEIWFTQKGSTGASTLYSLTDLKNQTNSKIRFDENFENNYLVGKYGAVPELHDFNILYETNHEES